MLPRPDVKTSRSAREEDQRRRRRELLDRQKGRRAAQTAQSRALVPGLVAAAVLSSAQPAAPAVEDDDFDMGGATTDGAAASSVGADADMGVSGSAQGHGGHQRGSGSRVDANALLVGAEWLVDIPDDLAQNWVVAARPTGRRCLVIAHGGQTTAHWRGGRAKHFPSALPGGSRHGARGPAAAGGCELDCIFVEATSTFYVLDALAWKGHRLVDCAADFRHYWLADKIGETRASETTSRNPLRFAPLPRGACTAAALRDAYGSPAEFEKDGLLFWHREALYEPGPSPLLLLWGDAHCSRRFYDYGSEQMEQAVKAEPSKAARWKTAEVDAAWAFADLIAAVEPCMEMS